MHAFPEKRSDQLTEATCATDVADAPNAGLLSLDAQLCFLLYSSAHAMTRLYKPLLDRLGLTYPQYLVMMVLWEADDQTVNALGQRLELDSGTLTPLLRRMADKGLLVRERDADDERRVRVRLTPAGLALREQAGEVPKAVLCALGVDEAGLVRLRETLREVRQRIGTPG